MNRRSTRYGSVIVLLVSSLAGCSYNRYEVRIEPGENGVEREITTWREGAGDEDSEVLEFPADELSSIAKAYGAEVPGDLNKKHRFRKSFLDAVPNDLGGVGSHVRWETPLGLVSGYVERVRGSDDLLTEVEARQHSAGQLADLLTSWLMSELKGHDGADQLKLFLENQFRRDMINLSLQIMAYEYGSQDQRHHSPELMVRIGQYLLERDYFTVDQLPEVARTVSSEDSKRLLAWIQRLVAHRMGVAVDAPIPDSLAFLSDEAVCAASLNAHISESAEFQGALSEWEKSGDDQSPENKPTLDFTGAS